MRIFDSIDQYPFAERYGSVNLAELLDVSSLSTEADHLLNSSPLKKFRGRNDLNVYVRVPEHTALQLSAAASNLTTQYYDWTWEYYRSGEPVGMHTDYKSFDNVWYQSDPARKLQCHVVLGLLVPLSWTSKQPYTLFFDKFSSRDKKLIFSKGHMRYQESGEIVEYQTDLLYDPAVLEHIPEHVEYGNQSADLKLHNVYKWQVNTGCFFDTRQWHASSWFLEETSCPPMVTKSKTGIIGFASINVEKFTCI